MFFKNNGAKNLKIREDQGFTIVEIGIAAGVVVFLLLIIVIIISVVGNAGSNNKKRESGLKKIQDAIEECYIENHNAYGASFTERGAFGDCMKDKFPRKTLPKDPKTGAGYDYVQLDDGSDYTLTAYQDDGKTVFKELRKNPINPQ